MKLLALSAAGHDLVDSDLELASGSRVRVRFDVSQQEDGSLASWEPDVFHDEPIPPGTVGKVVDAIRNFNTAARHLGDS